MNQEQIDNVILSIAKALNEVDDYGGVLPGRYDWEEVQSLPANRDFLEEMGKAALMALAHSYDLVSIEQLLSILEMNRGKR